MEPMKFFAMLLVFVSWLKHTDFKSKLTGQIDKLQRDLYGVKEMLQIYNMNPTSEDVSCRYQDHNKDSSGLTLQEFKEVFEDYLIKQDRVPDVLTRTVNDLFEGPVSKRELRKILTEIGSEALEPEEADEVINEISFNGNGHVTQDGWLEFLLYLVNIKLHNENQQDE